MCRIFIGVRIEVILFIEYCAVPGTVLISYCLLSLSLSLSLSDGTQLGQAEKVRINSRTI